MSEPIFVWTVTSMDCYPQADGQTDVVFTVNWNCEGAQESGGVLYKAAAYSSCGVMYEAGQPFTPYDQLTQEQVLDWIWISGVDKTAIEASVQNKLDWQINPPVVTLPLPWSA